MENATSFDLKSFRESSLNMTQEQFAEMLGVRQDVISRMEKNSGQISLEMLMNIASKTGTTLDELVKFQKPVIREMAVDYTWSSPEFVRKTLIDYIGTHILSFDSGERALADIDGLQTIITQSIRKPKIAFVGRSDVGKSAMINALLGSTKMPTSWSPTTSIAVYIKHIKDRPSFMSEDVWIFRSEPGTQNEWDDSRLQDEIYCKSLKLSSGNYELLNAYGTRFGENYVQNEASAAVVFINSAMLLNCDVIDLPGFGTGDRFEDDMLTLKTKQKADVLVYLSIANGFMRGEDISYIKESISGLSIVEARGDSRQKVAPLSNLFIVASQAHAVDKGNPISLTKILDEGCTRFERTLSERFWDGRSEVSGCEYTHDLLRQRFFTYTADIASLRVDFEDKLRYIIEILPKTVEQQAKHIIKTWAQNKSEAIQIQVDNYAKLLEERETCEETLREYDKQEPARYSNFQKERHKITSQVQQYKGDSIQAMRDYYQRTITVDNILSLMESRDVKKKKDDIQLFSSYVTGLLQDESEAILKKKSKDLQKDIDAFLYSFESSCRLDENNGVAFDKIPFNAPQAFAAGLTGVATFGALAFWAASCGNLGGYILVAKGVSLLSALGISVGGTAAATSAVAAIGGPIVLGIALALIAALSVFAIFSGGWKKSVAKKLVSACEGEKVLSKLMDSICKFWDDTQVAFDASADHLNEEWKKYVESLRELLNGYDVDELTAKIHSANEVQDFLAHIPL